MIKHVIMLHAFKTKCRSCETIEKPHKYTLPYPSTRSKYMLNKHASTYYCWTGCTVHLIS
jgi:hypothetical protein